MVTPQVPQVKWVVLVLALVLGLSCKDEGAGAPGNIFGNKPSSPEEAKKKRLAEMAKEAFEIMERAEKDPNQMNDPEMKKRMQELKDEAKVLLKELAGGDRRKEDEIIEDSLKKYEPECYKKMMAAKREAQKRRMHANLRSVKTAIETYYVMNAVFPESLNALLEEEEANRLIDSIPIDRFSKNEAPVKYSVYTAGQTTYVAWSVGPNGISDIQGAGDDKIIGGPGDDIFITNAQGIYYK